MNRVYPFESGVPCPESVLLRVGRGRAPIYPWLHMAKDDSFVIYNRKASDCYSLVAKANKKYAPRRFVHGQEKRNVRIWRIA